ncbi:MAG: NIF family HAD-type phosphatase [Cyanobacteria bacterium P01_E01_bin.42]
MTIVLDIEGTLISNAVSQIPRPGLYKFLEFCNDRFDRIVIYTAVNEVAFRGLARTLIEQGNIPSWFVDLEYIKWQGNYKDLAFIPNIDLDRVVIVDDREEYIKPDQKDCWRPILGYNYPYSNCDRELHHLIEQLQTVSCSCCNSSIKRLK